MTEQALPELARRLELVVDPQALFGREPAAQVTAFRRLARATHPDLHPDDSQLAARAFARLSDLWAQRHGVAQEPVEITTRRRTYLVGPVVRTDDVAVTHAATFVEPGGAGGAAQVRLPRSPADNDLMEAEAVALRTLAASDLQLQAFVPRLLEKFRHRDVATGVERRTVVLLPPATEPGTDTGTDPGAASAPGDWRDLAAVAADHRAGLDPRDVVWMWRRGLLALGFAHRSGLVHGAPVPENVLVETEQHGLVLTGWTSSVRVGEPLRAVPAAYRHWYPAAVAARAGAAPATDVALLTRAMSGLVGDRAPEALRAFARGCAAPGHRIDAWQLLAELTDLVERLYGPRRFRPFPSPTSTPA